MHMHMSKSSSGISEKMETYHGVVRTPTDAIKLFEACRLGLLPRVQRRLSEKERQSIRSGSVFVWDEREAGMRRWTDGKSWSASRVSGSFLTYREMEGKRGGFGAGRRGHGKTSDSDRGSDEDHDDGEPEGYRYKADGLMKQSFSIATSAGQSLHLISYYSRPQPGEPELLQPTTDPALRGIVPVRGMYPESSMGETNQTPALTRTPMQQPPYMMSSQHNGYQVPPQHQQPYAPQYAQPGYTPSTYAWPPSPVATPPYGQYGSTPYPPSGHHLPAPYPTTQPPLPPHSQSSSGHFHHLHSQPQQPSALSPHSKSTSYSPQTQAQATTQTQTPTQTQPSVHPASQQYTGHGSALLHECAPLPSPYHASQAHGQAPSSSQPFAHGSTPSRPLGSPRQQHSLQAAAQAAIVDSRLSMPRIGGSSQGPLPALNAVTHGVLGTQNSSSHTGLHTPPTRTLSVTPPEPSSHPEFHATTGRTTNLALILHPTPSSSESGNNDSAHSSPRAAGMSLPEQGGVSEDFRALRALDRKFCIKKEEEVVMRKEMPPMRSSDPYYGYY